MLIKKEILEGIKEGEITHQYRSWKRPTVKTGGTLRTSVGMLEIKSVEPIGREELSDKDADKAGFSNLDQLLASLRDGEDRQLYRIRLSYAGADPRKQLREDDELSDEELENIAGKLEGIDNRSRSDPWTYRMLQIIELHPGRPAAELANHLEIEKPWLKRKVRKLKELGLTISLSPGYKLSPRGDIVYKYLEKKT